MTAIRLCLYVAICFVSLTPLAFVIVRDARVDFFRPIFVGLFTFVVIRDIAMRRRSWLWFLSGASIAIASFFLAFALMPEEWYAPEERAWFNRQTWDRLDPNKTQDWGVGREVIGLTSAIVNPLDTMSAYRKVRHRDDARHAQSAAILKHLQSRSAEKYSMRSVMQQNYRGRVNREALNSRMYPNQAPKSKARAMPSWNNYKVQPNTSIKRLPASPKPVTPVSTVPNTPVSSIEKGRAYYTQGLVHSQKGEYDAAIRDYALAIEYGLMPDLLAEAYLHKSLMHYRKDDFDAAIRDCEQAVKVKPDDTNIYVFRAALHYQMRNYDKAWADVNICQKLGGAVPPDFLAALQKASGRRQ
jgi:tetratricopeptide (TPR) repeat protein